MPSSFSFVLNRNSLSDNDSNSDEENIDYTSQRGTILVDDNQTLERPSDLDASESDVTDNDDIQNQHPISKTSARFSSLDPIPAHYLTRQVTLYENDWPQRSSFEDQTSGFDTSQPQSFAPERSHSTGIEKKSGTHLSESQHYSIAATQAMRSTVSFQNPTVTSTQQQQRKPPSRIPVPTSPSRRISSPSKPSKIPKPALKSNKQGAFRFFTADDRPNQTVEATSAPIPPSESSQSTTSPKKQISPFAPIQHRTTGGVSLSSFAGHTPLLKFPVDKQQGTSDDDESEGKDLKESELKQRLKAQKRHGRETGQLLHQLHENYNQLLEKYAQAENTIDQLRFQPKMVGEYSPPTHATEGTVHFIHQPSMNMTAVRSSGIYQSISGTPMSSIVPRPSTTSNMTTTTTTTTARKSTSPANSGTVESVFFDEVVPQKIIVEELTTPETIKLDLLLHTRALSEKMQSFLTLMDANQLSLVEQKQVYETIKDDYEKLVKMVDRKNQYQLRMDLDVDADINDELENMKQLLKEIVRRITDNIKGKSSSSSDTDRQSRLAREESHSSQVSVRSSLCNHADLMDQYKKLLKTVNAEMGDQENSIYPELKTTKKTTPTDSSSLNLFDQQPYVYPFQNFDGEQRQSHEASIKDQRSSPSHLDYITSNLTRYQQQSDEETTQINSPPRTSKKQIDLQDYDNLSKTKRKIYVEQKNVQDHQREQDLTPSSVSIRTAQIRSSAGSMPTRASDYDSGFGTHNTTKLSRDSKLNTSTMDESHDQSFDEEQRLRRRHGSDEDEDEREFLSSSSSSRSSGSGATNSPSNKFTKRFNSSSSLKLHRDKHRRKPSGHSDGYPSDIETHITGSFDPIPLSPAFPSLKSSYGLSNYQQRKTRRHPQSCQPRRAHSISHHRSASIESLELPRRSLSIHRPQTAPSQSSNDFDNPMVRKYQAGFVHRSSPSSRHSTDRMYQSSVYIDQAHTHRRSQEALQPSSYYEPLRSSNSQKTYSTATSRLYMDPRTGMIYRYEPTSHPPPPSHASYVLPKTSIKSSDELYRCSQCGTTTNYYHRHHIESKVRRLPNDVDDPGYESGNRKNKQIRRQAVELVSSSASDTDETGTSLDLALLNEAFERAKKVQHRSHNLSRHISRQLKLVLATM